MQTSYSVQASQIVLGLPNYPSNDLFCVHTLEYDNWVWFQHDYSQTDYPGWYSFDGTNWTQLTITSSADTCTKILLNKQHPYVYLKAFYSNNALTSTGQIARMRLKTTKQFNVSGKLSWLVNASSSTVLCDIDIYPKTGFGVTMRFFEENNKIVNAEYLQLNFQQPCFRRLFYNCTSLRTAPELWFTQATNECYDSMFYNTKIFKLHMILLENDAQYCLSNMYRNCKNILMSSTGQAPYSTRWFVHAALEHSNCGSMFVGTGGEEVTIVPGTFYYTANAIIGGDN